MNAPRRLRDAAGHYQRPALERSGPDRRFRTYYRSAEGSEPGIGGQVPRTLEQAVVQAVRVAYQVADEQIARSSRLASRLKQAGDAEVGPDSDLKALDALERLTLKTMMAGLGWLESASAETGSPLRRLAALQYRSLGMLLGLVDPPDRSKAGAAAAGGSERTAAPPAQTAPPPPPAVALQVVYKGDERRALLGLRSNLPTRVGPGSYPAKFYSAEDRPAPHLEGELQVNAEGARELRITTRASCPAGWWATAICTEDGRFLGNIEILL